ncbi:hypothetical protein [Microbacterium sp. YY-01]|uniref:hypothetical protein n=1 Tax=Microbacterium sp. YY-01 TaxID=3421634 RepID=UPI003D16F27A
MKLRHRFAALSVLAGAALVIAGCASGPQAGDQPAPTEDPQQPAETGQIEATWLDTGRFIGVVTWGSSGCVPLEGETIADGQNITTTLSLDDEDAACTADFAPRATLIGVPEGVDATQDATLTVELPEGETAEVTIAGNDTLTGELPDQFVPSAGWAGDQIVLLSWGSSSCPPLVDAIDEDANSARVTFVTEDRPCTMDLAPRLTIITPTQAADHSGYQLTLTGADFSDDTLDVIG